MDRPNPRKSDWFDACKSQQIVRRLWPAAEPNGAFVMVNAHRAMRGHQRAADAAERQGCLEAARTLRLWASEDTKDYRRYRQIFKRANKAK